MIQFLPLATPPIVIIATAVMSNTPDTFFANHPDAAEWLMVSMVGIICFMAMNSYRKLMKELKELQEYKADCAREIAVIQQACKDRKELCSAKFEGLS